MSLSKRKGNKPSTNQSKTTSDGSNPSERSKVDTIHSSVRKNDLSNVKNIVSIRSRILRKLALSISLMAIMYLYFYLNHPSQDQYRAMASVRDHIAGPPLAQQLPCSGEYARERQLFPRCVPLRCGRLVSDTIVREHEAIELRLLAETVFAVAQPSGGVAIFDLNSGALSNGTKFINLYQILKMKNSKLIKQKTLDTFATVKKKLMHIISIHFGISPDQLHLTSPVFFTKITNAQAVTLNDEYWHAHVDKVTYGTFMYTSLVYLSTYKEEFNGGRFVFLDPAQNITIEPKLGRVSAFTSSSENSHMVEPVSSGARFALTIPFTCDPSKGVKDPNIT